MTPEQNRMIKAVMAFAVVALAFGKVAVAQSAAVEHQVKGPADREIQIGAYIKIKPDCMSGRSAGRLARAELGV